MCVLFTTTANVSKQEPRELPKKIVIKPRLIKTINVILKFIEANIGELLKYRIPINKIDLPKESASI